MFLGKSAAKIVLNKEVSRKGGKGYAKTQSLFAIPLILRPVFPLIPTASPQP